MLDLSWTPGLNATLLVLVKATLLLALARTLVAALPRIPAAAKHLILMAGIASFVIVPALTFSLPDWRIHLPQLAAVKTIATVAIYPEVAAAGEPSPVQAPAALPAAAAAGPAAPAEKSPAAPAAPVREERPFRLDPAMFLGGVLILWFAGAALFLFRLAIGALRVRQLVRSARPVSDDALLAAFEETCARMRYYGQVRLLESGSVDVPQVCGVLRPSVILPSTAAEWTSERRRSVLLHEVAHLRRFDCFSLLLSRFVTAVFWFHPMVWEADRRTRECCEIACDDLVVGTGERASDYAGHLLDIVRSLPSTERIESLSLAVTRRSRFEERLRSILNPGGRPMMNRNAVIAVAVAFVILVIPVSVVSLTAAPPQQTMPLLDSPDHVARAAETDEHLAKRDERIARTKIELAKNRKQWKFEEADSFNRGYALHSDGRYAEAIEEFKKSVENGHRDATAMYNIACGYALLGDRENALSWLERSLAAGFDSADHLAEDSDLASLRNDPRFQKIAEDALNGKWNRAQARQTRKLDRLEKKAEELKASASTNGRMYYSVGSDLLRNRRLDEGIDLLQQAVVHLGENNSSALYNLACAYALRGDEAQAIEYLQRSVDAGFDDADHIRSDSDLASIRRDPRFERIAKWADALSFEPFNDFGWDGDRKYSARRWQPAVEHFTRMSESYPQSGQVWYKLGMALHYSREFDRARSAFERSIALRHKPGASSYNVACGYALQRNSDEAFAWLEKSVTAGYRLEESIHHDDDLDSLRRDSRFRQFEERFPKRWAKDEFDFDFDELGDEIADAIGDVFE